ncbi:MAG: ATP-binding cassette domain-containing protein [Gammaproteobacteria bacterium]|nr:ATP-binding cassette domain-containing protein [Gammaproteobacteria bacterium]
MINLENITVQRGTRLLLQDVTLSIFAKQKIGVIGINGSGKSSLFAVLQRKLQVESGKLFIQPHLRIAHLKQELPNSEKSALHYVLEGDPELHQLLQKMEQTQNDPHALAIVHHKLYEIDGYAAEAKAAQLLNGLGFTNEEHSQPVNSFSGGWRMRLNLAQVLMSRANLLLLDEPTNHLDLDAIVWLENWLKKHEGTLLLISHDRDFLDNVVDHIVHINNQTLKIYKGNYSNFEIQRAAQLEREKALFDKEQKQIEHLDQFIRRFRAKATKAKQVQSRIKLLENMKKTVLTRLTSPFSFSFFQAKPCTAPLLRFENVSFLYEKKPIFSSVNFSLEPNDRIGFLGPNGAGKSTFMKLLSRSLQANQGESFFNKNLKIGYFAQHQIEQLNLLNSAFTHMQLLDEKAQEQQIRDFLGRFHFHGDKIFEPLNQFSGGEKARFILAMIVWQKPNLLLLDEPTNHLDLDMREALTYALQDYSGAFVLVSHDRYLLKATVDDYYLVNNQSIEKFDGDLMDYQKFVLDRTNKETSVAKQKQNNTVKHEVNKQIKNLENQLKKYYEEKETIEQKLKDNHLYRTTDSTELNALLTKLENIKKEIHACEKKWVELEDK